MQSTKNSLLISQLFHTDEQKRARLEAEDAKRQEALERQRQKEADRKQLKQDRGLAISLRSQGETIKDIADRLQYTTRTIQKWLAVSRNHSPEAAIAGGIAGRPLGSGTLPKDKQAAILGLIISRPPTHLSGSMPFWDRATIKKEVSQRLGLDIPERTITDYLRRWGLYAEIPEADPHVQESISARARAKTIWIGQRTFRLRGGLANLPPLKKHASRDLVMRFAIHGQGKGKLLFLVQEYRDGEVSAGIESFMRRLGQVVAPITTAVAAAAPRRRKPRFTLVLIGMEDVDENGRAKWTSNWHADVEIIDLPVKSEPMFPEDLPHATFELPIRTHKMQR